jgi:precorrin-6Y C5,15-methyltransferase (decarboxylating)
MTWQDMKLMSIHGRKQNIISAVRTNRKVFTLVDAKEGIQELAQMLLSYGYSDIHMYVGNQLSYPEEKLLNGNPGDFLEYDCDGLSAAILFNENADKTIITHGLSDDSFIRGKAPMTKEEIRSISISKLALTKDAIVYDIGAGTGSIGIECALQVTEGNVYAVEKKEDALVLLNQNQMRLGTDNLEIISGIAPEALTDLPAPTHAFIGGSSGNMEEIIQLLIEKNPKVRIVINAIAMETVMEVMQVIKKETFAFVDIVQVSVGKAKVLADYHMMMEQNPVYIFTLQKEM